MSTYPKGKEPICGECDREPLRDRAAAKCQRCARTPGWWKAIPPGAFEGLHSFEQAWQQWQREIGMAKDRYVRPAPRIRG